VYVVGAVARPGLYRIGAGARIDDAVRRAGGLRADADPAGVNLAAHAGDGDEIDVPVRGERATAAAPRAKRTRGKRTVKTTQPVNVNDADARQLALIPGIGPAIAARIVAVRDRDGAFTSLDQLLDVAGMTQARLDRAQDFLRVN
jgi:competence protein ComEA